MGTYNLSIVNSLTLPAQKFFNKSITLSKPGVYILEINTNKGLALIKRPVYVGTGLPLLPDSADFLPLSYHQNEINGLISAQPKSAKALRSKSSLDDQSEKSKLGKVIIDFGHDFDEFGSKP